MQTATCAVAQNVLWMTYKRDLAVDKAASVVNMTAVGCAKKRFFEKSSYTKSGAFPISSTIKYFPSRCELKITWISIIMNSLVLFLCITCRSAESFIESTAIVLQKLVGLADMLPFQALLSLTLLFLNRNIDATVKNVRIELGCAQNKICSWNRTTIEALNQRSRCGVLLQIQWWVILWHFYDPFFS